MLSLKRNCIEDKKHFLIYCSEYNDLNEDFHSFIILRAYPHKFYASTRLNKIEVILESHAYTRKLRRVSLPKSESRLLIRKMDIPFFLVKSKTGLLIQMIHNGGAFFGSYPKWDTLDTRSEEFLYYGSEKEEYVGRLYE